MAKEGEETETEDEDDSAETEEETPPEKPKEEKFTRRDVRREVKKAVRALREQEDEKGLELLEAEDAWVEGRRHRKTEERIARLEARGSGSGVGEVLLVALLAVAGIGLAFWDTIRERFNRQ